MIATIIYDSSGKIWNVAYGNEELPSGIKAMICDIPENVMSVDAIDMNSEKPVFSYVPQANMDNVNAGISEALAKIEQMSNALLEPMRVFAETLDDDRAIKAKSIYPEWNGNNEMYKKGDRVRYNDILYTVLSEHLSQPNWMPNFAPSLYAKVLTDYEKENGVEWQQPDSTNPYSKGDKVVHNGLSYESLIDGNVWEPGVLGTETLWKEIIQEPESDVEDGNVNQEENPEIPQITPEEPEENNIYPIWQQPDSTNPYHKGDRVLHNGKVYESVFEGNVWEPTVDVPGLWKEVTNNESTN